jgi:zinc transporter 1/2/3
MDNTIIASIILFFISICGCYVTRFFRPGPFLISAQAFASGSLLGLSILHYIPLSIESFESMEQPLYLYIAIATYAVFTFLEHIPASHSNSSFQDSLNSDASNRDFSQFLVHHFSTVPSRWMLAIVFLFLLMNSVFMGIGLSCARSFIAFTVAASIAKLVEAFTLGLLLQTDQTKPLVYWICVIVYSLTTPITALCFPSKDNNITKGVFSSISLGFFLYLGILLWRATFLLPFDWRKSELVYVCASFAIAIIIEALTCLLLD